MTDWVLGTQTTSHPVLEIAELWPPQGEWTEEDYFSLPDTNRLIELSGGDLVMPPYPTNTHQAVVGELFAVLRTFVRERNLGTVRIAPLPVRLWPGKIREPDVLFVSEEHADRIGEDAYGPPDLVMEVLSPSSWRIDRREKAEEYAGAGVGEYWIVDPEMHTVEVFVLRQGVYEILGKWGVGEEARSEILPGFVVPLGDLFAEDL